MLDPLNKVIEEIDKYKKYVVREQEDIKKQMTENTFDLSSWWNNCHSQFPYLSCTVKSYLCVPATSVNCERAFSTATDLITKKRNRLSAETVRKLTFLRDNFKHIP